MFNFWIFAPAIIAVFCIWQTVRSVRNKDYPMAVFGSICAALILLMPIGSHVVKIDLPMDTSP